ncbi:MAG: helix-turn-helix domain-containing protein, partial [Oscillospiraceae bacterium]|nr:helix-turn-helix domain-containing protein [Oscillospiraceae bacterium]
KTLMSDDPMVKIEKRCIERVGALKFTSYDEMVLFENMLLQSEHVPKTKLAMLRKESGLLLDEIAEILKISKNGYYKIEAGVSFPKLSLALKMAKLFNVTVEELFIINKNHYYNI